MVVTALMMGLVGGPHCVVMCGAACAGISKAAGDRGARALWIFQLHRALGYGLMGAAAAGTVQGLAWFASNTSVIRPVWTMVHVAAVLLGVTLVVLARQPAWMDGLAQRAWRRAKPVMASLGSKAPMLLGTLWALMPCGLLYSALMVASLSASALSGAVIMVAFALGTTVSLVVGPWLLLRLNSSAGSGGLAIRVAGLALVATSGWALWSGLTNPTGLWCM